MWARNYDVIGQSGLCYRAITDKQVLANIVVELQRVMEVDSARRYALQGPGPCRGGRRLR
jgi:hypothetical protein